jgi:hypothetical protein
MFHFHFRKVGIKGSLISALAWVLIAASPSLCFQQSSPPSTSKYQHKVGVLPFVDNTGSGGQETGAAIGRAVQAEMAYSTELVGRVLKQEEGVGAEDLDAEKAVEIGRLRKVDVLLMGTVLEANSEESERGAQTPSIFGQSVGARARSVKAVVTLQCDLFNVVNGQKFDSIRVTGRASDTKVGADVSTDLGSISTAGGSFQSSPIGKALHNAVAELVKKIAADQPKMLRYQPGGEPTPPEKPTAPPEEHSEDI